MGVYTGLQVEDDSGAVFHKDKLGNYWADYRIRYPHALPATRRTWDTPYTTYGDAISSDPYPLRFRLDPSPPVAIAGPDQTVDQNTAVYLDGSRSSDDRRIVEYFWNFTYDGTLRSLKGEFTSFTFADAGVYTVTLTVLDAWGNRGEDTMRVTVRDITPPLANAGSDLTIDMNEEFELTADGSLDNVGIVSWKWYIRGEDLDEEFEEWKLTYSISNPGTYTAEVVLYDAAGNKGSDTITIEVIDIIPPNAVAGPDRTVDQGTLVTFNGSASTDNVGIDRFSWVFQYDGAEVSLQEMVSPFLFEMPGTYEVTLYCHDVYDLSDADVMILTVVDTEPPVASGHTDMTVDQGTTTQLVDGGSTDNVGITRYKWTFHYAGGDVTLEGQSTTFTFDEVGEYEVTLRVEDVEGNADQVRFTISVLDTESPVADLQRQWIHGQRGNRIVLLDDRGRLRHGYMAVGGDEPHPYIHVQGNLLRHP